jgi:hypothetical protein
MFNAKLKKKKKNRVALRFERGEERFLWSGKK